MSLIKSRQRVADHGEVFTPPWLVERMLDLVRGETERIDSRFLEPACGSGNFLVPVLRRKLAAVERSYARAPFERGQYALLAVMCAYGIELLADNIAECRANLLEVFAGYLSLDPSATSTAPPASCSIRTSSTATPSPYAPPPASPSPSQSGAISARASSSAATSASNPSRKCPPSAPRACSLPTRQARSLHPFHSYLAPNLKASNAHG